MNTYVAIFEHVPEQCPASSKENLERTTGSMSKMEAIAKDLGVEVAGIHVLLPGHKGIAIVNANDYETAGQFFLQLGIQDWNDITLYRSYPPQEALGDAAERFAAV